MKPILYGPEEMNFDTNGIGVLTDAISCKVKQVLNGQYEMTMQYPVSGLHFKQLCRRMVILAKADPVSELQPFRIYRITKPSNGIVTVYARHMAYDLNGIAVTPFAAENVILALEGFSRNSVPDCPFTFTTDKDTAAPFSVAVPTSSWTLLGGTEGSVLDKFGGEYEFDRWNVRLWNSRGMDRGVSIRYGKNLTSLEQDENCANCYTGVLPYWVDQNTNAVMMLPGKTVAAEGNFGYTKILPLDLSGKFQQKPSEAEMEAVAKAYITDNKICEPIVSWKVEFVQLEQTEEYKGMALLERVLLGDTVEVVFEEMEICVKSRAVEGLFDSVLERYDYVTLGSVRANIADTIASQNKDISTKPNKSEMQLAIERLTGSILGARGGSVRFLDTDGDGLQDTLYIADNADPALATKVWRFNYEGWGASSNGYNGPFVMGATLDEGVLADFIKAGTLDAKFVKVINLIAEQLESVSGVSKLSITGAVLKMLSGNNLAVKLDNEFADENTAQPILYMHDYRSGERKDSAELSPHSLKIGGTSMSPTFSVVANGNTVGEKGNVYSVMKIDAINPGKKVLYSDGTVAAGSSMTVDNTAHYDLFAVQLGSSSSADSVVVLAYKVGNTIRGVGGWAGDATTPKVLYFVSATFSGNTWTLVDANKQSIAASGSVGSATSLCIKEVIGII